VTIDHLQSLVIEFKRYFSEFKEEEDALVPNPFSTSLVIANILKYRTNFVIFGIIHQHVICFMKCHFLDSGGLCVNNTHNCLNGLFEYCFNCHNISLRVVFQL